MKEKLLVSIVRSINRMIPKNEEMILFESTPDFADNANAMFCYIKNKNKNYKLIWIVNENKLLKKFNKKNILAYPKFNLKGLFYFFRSKHIFLTHNTYGNFKCERQVLINLWHGMPLKAMGFMEPLNNNINLKYLKKSFGSNDMLIATSTVMKSALASCLYINPRKIHLTGQPRNDKLFDKDSKTKLSNLLKLDLNKYKKIVFFCPTFRKWESRVDGIPKESNIFNFDDFDEDIFKEFLRDDEILFLLKFHPFEEEHFLSKLSKQEYSDNLNLITNEMLQKHFFDLYDILGAMDILITDYSSVYFDFLLINHPIIFTPTDLEKYSKNRGFLFEPYDFWAPGPKATNFKDFLEELGKCIKNPDYYKKERKLVNDIVNKYQDNKSCERVYDLVFGKE